MNKNNSNSHSLVSHLFGLFQEHQSACGNCCVCLIKVTNKTDTLAQYTQFPKSQNLIFINLTLKYDAFLFRTYKLKIETILGSGSYFQLSCFAVSISERANSEFPQH